MASINEITIGESRRINMGNYESKEISLYIKANVANQEMQDVVPKLNKQLTEYLNEKEKEIRRESD